MRQHYNHLRAIMATGMVMALVLGSQKSALGDDDLPTIRPGLISVQLRHGRNLRVYPDGTFSFGYGSSPADYVQANFGVSAYTQILKNISRAHVPERRPGWYNFTFGVNVDGAEESMRVSGAFEDREIIRPWIDRVLDETLEHSNAARVRESLRRLPAFDPPATQPAD